MFWEFYYEESYLTILLRFLLFNFCGDKCGPYQVFKYKAIQFSRSVYVCDRKVIQAKFLAKFGERDGVIPKTSSKFPQKSVSRFLKFIYSDRCKNKSKNVLEE